MTANLTNYYKQSIVTLNRIGMSLSYEKDKVRLLKSILSGAIEITHCDAGILYFVQDKQLIFTIIQNHSLDIEPCEIKETNLSITPIPLYLNDQPNKSNNAAACYHDNKIITIDDAYQDHTYDFFRKKQFDAKLNYISKSLLVIPLHDHDDHIIGVLELINALDDHSNIVPFDDARILFAESLAARAAIILTRHELMRAQKELFESLLKLLANMIDAKSQHTSNHCTRVPIITNMIADALNHTDHGPLKNEHLSPDEVEELMISSWLHDCGKISTPDYVVNKSTKLQTITDRIEMIDARIEILKRDAKISFLENQTTKNEYLDQISKLDQSKIYLNKINIGGEFLSDEKKEWIKVLGTTHHYLNGNDQQPLLTESEIENLCISRGTLNKQEREIIQNHVAVTYDMLKSLPYPKHLKRVPEIASAHHERVDGKGYPHGKKEDELLIQSRILAIADIFEALTSADRPYKTAKPLSEVIAIMTKMKESGHIDAQLFDLFIENKIHVEFAKQYMSPEQIDL